MSSVLNLRSEPDGEIIGRVAPEQTFTVNGPAVCLNGYRWLPVRLHSGPVVGGWIAEADGSAYLVGAPRPQPPATPLSEVTPENSGVTVPAPPRNHAPRQRHVLRRTQPPARAADAGLD